MVFFQNRKNVYFYIIIEYYNINQIYIIFILNLIFFTIEILTFIYLIVKMVMIFIQIAYKKLYLLFIRVSFML